MLRRSSLRLSSRWSWLGLCLALFALLALTHTAPAQAQGPVTNSSVRIFHTTDWYRTHAPELNQANGNLIYYGGRVMHTSTTYAIYWTPAGYKIGNKYKKLIKRYFSDIGGTNFYKIVTQYYEKNPTKVKIANTSAFGGSWVDTTPFPSAGNAANPLQDADIQASVRRAIAANGWPTGYTNQYFVFTPLGIESCIDASTCTPGTAHPAFCAYHGLFDYNSDKVIYANMPYAATWGAQCGLVSKSPNNNPAADTEISIISHEHFEAVTDADPPPGGPEPPTTAWTDSAGYEIGDKCAYSYGAKNPDGSNIILHGNPYIMQLEWSNRVSGCAKKY